LLLAELVAAFTLLTRLPVGWLLRRRAPGSFADSVWAYPVAGAAVGGIAAAAYWACDELGLPPAVAAVWALAAGLLATGALHEDGLADTADGLGGGRSRVRKLEIMRDSRIGSFGALALVLSLAARGTAIAAIAGPGRVAAALVAAAAVGRGAMIVLLLLLSPARTDGLAAGLRTASRWRAALGLALAASVAFALLPAGPALWACAGGLAAALMLAWLARRQIGGYTGDVLGATSVLGECVVLGLLAASRTGWPVSR
jgi:adenosylcobinamide-GDP ribazoletransferase